MKKKTLPFKRKMKIFDSKQNMLRDAVENT
jgi:hypothetical protein